MQSSAIFDDDHGAIAVIALLMAVFLVGALYYVVGLGHAALLRERLQDAADAGAFSTAVVQARGMNLLVLINLVMSALLAVLVALKLVQALAIVASAVLAGLAWICWPCAALLPEVLVIENNVKQAADTVRQQVMPMLDVLHSAAHAIRDCIPVIAQVEVVDTVLSRYSPPASFGFAIPSSAALPTKDDDYSKLCRKAGEFAGDMALLPLNPLLAQSGLLRDAVGGAVGSLAASGSDWFCGADGAKPPEYEVSYWEHLPTLPERQACKDARGNKGDIAQVCALATAAEARSMPDALTGECANVPCDSDRYALRARLARDVCNPNTDHELTDYGWQERTVTRQYAVVHGVWQLIATSAQPPQLIMPPKNADPTKGEYGERGDGTLPCPGARGQVEWNPDQPQPGQDAAPTPVCTELLDSVTQSDRGIPVSRTDTVREVLRIFHCDKHVKHKQAVEGFGGNSVASDGSQSSSYAPQGAKDGAEMGDDNFQARVVVLGKPQSSFAENVLRVASWGQPPAQGTWSAAEQLARYQVAQAEFYYDDPDASNGHVEWLWHMSWRARLRRFRMPSADHVGAGGGTTLDGLQLPATGLDACKRVQTPGTPDACTDLDTKLTTLATLIAH
ncbi:MAG TPA: Tad domain-containing protein [Polyangiales bacterium]